MNADPMEITSFLWASDADIVFNLRQQVRDKIEGFNRGTYEFKLGLLNIKTQKLKSFDELGISIEHRLAREPNKIIISMVEGWDRRACPSGRPYVPPAFVLGARPETRQQETPDPRQDLARQHHLRRRRQPLAGAGLRRGETGADAGIGVLPESPAGTSSGASTLTSSRSTPSVLRARIPTSRAMRSSFRATATIPWAFGPTELANKTFGEALYRRSDVDVGGAVGHSNPWRHPGTVVGLWYDTDKTHVEYPRRRGGSTPPAAPRTDSTCAKCEHRQPFAGWRNAGRLKLGSPRPGYLLPHPGGSSARNRGSPAASRLRRACEGRIRDVQGTGRDAHPGVRDDSPRRATVSVGGHAPRRTLRPGLQWLRRVVAGARQQTAILWSNPNSGIHGFGIALEKAAFEDGGQEGHKKQDDKDDAAQYLVKRGLADPDRMAMYGWSYGATPRWSPRRAKSRCTSASSRAQPSRIPPCRSTTTAFNFSARCGIGSSVSTRPASIPSTRWRTSTCRCWSFMAVSTSGCRWITRRST